MLSDVPNLASVFGYTNASWTLKSDLIADYVCRLLDHMDRRGYAICTPRRGDAAIAEEPTLPLTSGYIQRAKNLLPKQGTRKPWRMNQNYALDVMALRFGAIDDGALEFKRPDQQAGPREGRLLDFQPYQAAHGAGRSCEVALRKLERAKGIEPSYEAWEASVLPLNYARSDRPRWLEPAMAGEEGLEPPTPGFGDRCSTN